MSLATSVLHRSAVVTITDVRCRPHDPGACDVECAARDEMVVPRSGYFVRRSPAGEQHADASSVLFFGKDEPYEVRHPVPGGDDCTAFGFGTDVLRDAAPDGWPQAAVAPVGNRFVGLVQQLRRCLRDERRDACGDGLAADECAIALLRAGLGAAAAVRAPTKRRRRPATECAHRDLVAAVREVVAGSLGDPLALDGIARRVHSSPFHLARVFGEQTGASIHRFRSRLRLRAALDRIAGGEQDLSRLALDLGYASHSHLTDSFRREFGGPPSRYREAPSLARLRELMSRAAAAD